MTQRVPILSGSRVAVLNAPDDALILRPELPSQEAADVGRSIADQVAPLERTVDSELEASLDVDLDESVMEMS